MPRTLLAFCLCLPAVSADAIDVVGYELTNIGFSVSVTAIHRVGSTKRTIYDCFGTGVVNIHFVPVCRFYAGVKISAFCGTQRPLVRWSSGRCAV